MRQCLVIIYLVINTRLHHIGYALKTVKRMIVSSELFIPENLALSYDYH